MSILVVRFAVGTWYSNLCITHSLKPIDIEFMRQLHTRVNLIPIIAKADTLTDEEIAEFKARVSWCTFHLSSTTINVNI